jgi:hypothetical protein
VGISSLRYYIPAYAPNLAEKSGDERLGGFPVRLQWANDALMLREAGGLVDDLTALFHLVDAGLLSSGISQKSLRARSWD